MRQGWRTRPHRARGQPRAGACGQLAAAAGKRCTTAPDGRYALRVIARDVPGNTRAIDLGAVRARGVVLSVPDRAIVAGRRVRVGISADARGLRLELARLGAPSAVLARRTHAPAAVARVPASGSRRRLRRQQSSRRPLGEALLAVQGRGAPASRCWSADSPAPRSRRISGAWTRSGSGSTPSRCETPGRAISTATRSSSCRRSAAARPRSQVSARDESRRDHARARFVIPAALRAGRRRRSRRPARARPAPSAIASLLLVAARHAGAARLARRRPHVARARGARRRRAGRRARGRRRRGRALQRRPLALPFAACLAAPFRFPVHIGSQDANLLVPLYAVIGVAWLALVLDALRGSAPVRLPPRRLALPLAAARRLGGRLAGLERQRDRGRQGDRVLRAALRRAAGRARRAPAAAAAAGGPPASAGRPGARVRGRRRLPGAPARHLVEPQAHGLERVQLVLPRQLDLLRPVDLRRATWP